MEIISSAESSFYKVLKAQTYRISNASPNNVQRVELLERDWDTDGSVQVQLWKYTAGAALYIIYIYASKFIHV